MYVWYYLWRDIQMELMQDKEIKKQFRIEKNSRTYLSIKKLKCKTFTARTIFFEVDWSQNKNYSENQENFIWVWFGS